VEGGFSFASRTGRIRDSVMIIMLTFLMRNAGASHVMALHEIRYCSRPLRHASVPL
jgi:hypothetical protein